MTIIYGLFYLYLIRLLQMLQMINISQKNVIKVYNSKNSNKNY